MVAERARKASDVAARISASRGEVGLEELRGLYPDSYFYWTPEVGLIILWSGNRALIPRAVDMHAAYIQDLRTGDVLKNKAFEGELPEHIMPDEAKVAIVMES